MYIVYLFSDNVYFDGQVVPLSKTVLYVGLFQQSFVLH